MFIPNFILLLSLALQIQAAAFHRQSRFGSKDDDEGCPSAFLIGVRGTTEAFPYGAMEPLITNLTASMEGFEAEGLDYPASGIRLPENPGGQPIFNFIVYAYSEEQGRQQLSRSIANFVDYCPKTPFALMGYSQGAHVIGDTLCGRKGQLLFPDRDQLDPELLVNLKAIVQFGDPTNAANLTQRAGTASSEALGIFDRRDFEPCKQWEDKWFSYCDDKDFFCDRGDDSKIENHLHYVPNYGDKVMGFLTKQLKPKSKSKTHYAVEPCMDL